MKEKLLSLSHFPNGKLRGNIRAFWMLLPGYHCAVLQGWQGSGLWAPTLQPVRSVSPLPQPSGAILQPSFTVSQKGSRSMTRTSSREKTQSKACGKHRTGLTCPLPLAPQGVAPQDPVNKELKRMTGQDRGATTLRRVTW